MHLGELLRYSTTKCFHPNACSKQIATRPKEPKVCCRLSITTVSQPDSRQSASTQSLFIPLLSNASNNSGRSLNASLACLNPIQHLVLL